MPEPTFCGRDDDLAFLDTAWQIVQDEGRLQLVVLMAESGLGKTRLLQEFYARLARRYRASGDGGYWPLQLARREQNLLVNPDLDAVDDDYVMPFLWWALRLPDPAGRNQLLTSAVSGHVPLLGAHLQAMYRARRVKRYLLESGRSIASAALGAIPIFGNLIGVAEPVFELLQIGSQALDERTLRPDEAESAAIRELNESVVADLEQLFRRRDDEAAIPMVWAIDDAHFATADPGTVELFERIVTAAQRQRWPLLLVMTHWQREWAEHLAWPDTPSLAVATSETYGALHPEWEPYLLRAIPEVDLAPLLDEALPGLGAEQRRSLLLRTGGNPRFLEAIVQLCRQRPRYFEGRDPSGPLSEQGFERVMAESTTLHDLVEARLREAPKGVRDLITLSSLQGSRLLALVSDRLLAELRDEGYDLAEVDGREALALAETPYAFVNLLSDQLAEFSQRVFYEVARQGLEDLVDEDDAREALARTLSSLLGDDEATAELSDGERGRLFELAAELLGESDDPEERQRALEARARLLGFALGHFEIRAAAEMAKRALDGDLDGRWRLRDLPYDDLYACYRAFAAVDDIDRALALGHTLEELAEAADEPWKLITIRFKVADLKRKLGRIPEATQGYLAAFHVAKTFVTPGEETPIEAVYAVALLLERLGDGAMQRGDASGAFGMYREAFQMLWQVRERHDTPETAHRLMTLFAKVGDVWRAGDDLEDAMESYRSAHDIAERLAEYRGTPASRHDLAASHGRMSDLHREQGAAAEALEHAAAALALDRELAEHLDTPEQRRALATSLDRHARAQRLLVRNDQALAQQREAATILRQGVAESAAPEAPRALAMVLTHLGDSEAASGDDGTARARYQEAEALLRAEVYRFDAYLEHLDAQQTPHFLPVRRELMGTLSRLGRLLQRQGDSAAALSPLREAAAIAGGGEAVLTSPASAQTLALLLRDLSALHVELDDPEAARGVLVRGLEAAKIALERRPEPESEQLVAWFEARIHASDPGA